MLTLGFAALAAAEPPVAAAAHAAYAARAPALDRGLADPAWRAAPPLTRFFEIYPGDRAPPRESTEARFLYDARYLYVGVRLAFRSLDGVRAPFVRRDQVQLDQDFVEVDLDTLGAKRSAYVFRTNLRGSETDGYLNEARQIVNNDPDFAWDVHTARDPQGWTAVFRIPLSTLRLSHRGRQTWNVIITRGVPRADKVQLSSAPQPRSASCTLCFAGTLTLDDLEPAPDNLMIAPSAVAIARRDEGAAARNGRRDDHLRLQPSLDVKWLPYAGGAVDLTVKSDFSQVEADQPQLTANQRFALNFPEKRSFFREGTDLTTTPIPVLYSRTISAPSYGLRFTHRSEQMNFTAFAAADTGKGEIVEPGFLRSETALPNVDAQVGFGRGQVALGSVDLGVVATYKRNADGSFNALGGFDATWGTDVDRVTGHVVQSRTRDPNRPDLLSTWRGQMVSGPAGLIEWDHTGPAWSWTAMYARYEPGFRTWLGFVPRVGYAESFGQLTRIVGLDGVFNQAQAYVAVDRIDGLSQDGQEDDAYAGLTLTGLRATKIDLQVHPDAVALNEAGAARRQSYVQLSASANPARGWPLISLQAQAGQLIDFASGVTAPAISLNAEARLRPFDRLDLDGRYGLVRLADAPQGGPRLTETVAELSATWFFTARLYLLADLQLDRSDRRSPPSPLARNNLTSLQVTYEVDRNLHIYGGVRSGGVPSDGLTPASRQTEVYVKLSRTFHGG